MPDIKILDKLKTDAVMLLHGYQTGAEIYLLTLDKGLRAPLLQQLAKPNTVSLGRGL